MGRIRYDIDEITKIMKDYFKKIMNVKSVTYFYDANFNEDGWDFSTCHFEVVDTIELEVGNIKKTIDQKYYISYEIFIDILNDYFNKNNISISMIYPYKTAIVVDYKKDKTLIK